VGWGPYADSAYLAQGLKYVLVMLPQQCSHTTLS
jgi:hypothetical protein